MSNLTLCGADFVYEEVAKRIPSDYLRLHRKKVIAEKRGGLIEYDKRNGICKMYGGIEKDYPYGGDYRKRIYGSQKQTDGQVSCDKGSEHSSGVGCYDLNKVI